MILSRTLAKRRIDAQMRPSFWGAWLPVLFDLCAVFMILTLVWLPFLDSAANLVIIVLLGFALFFLPVQAVVIVSAMWAAKSRWEDAQDQQQDTR